MTPASSTDPDLTRKEKREQARAERKALEASAAQAARRTRMLQLGGVIGAAVFKKNAPPPGTEDVPAS